MTILGKKFSSKTQILLWLISLFFLIAIPSYFLFQWSIKQLKWEQVYQYRQNAEDVSVHINESLENFYHEIESLSISDFSFLKIEGDESYNFINRSELSRLPVKWKKQGVIGFFQVDDEGKFSSPVLPDEISDIHLNNESGLYHLSASEIKQRKKNKNKIFEILLKNQLIKTGMEKFTYLNAVKPKLESGKDNKAVKEALKDNKSIKKPADVPASMTVAEEKLEQNSLTQDNVAQTDDKSAKKKVNRLKGVVKSFDTLTLKTLPASKQQTKSEPVKQPMSVNQTAVNLRSSIKNKSDRKKRQRSFELDSVQENSSLMSESSKQLGELSPKEATKGFLEKIPSRFKRYRIKIFESEVEPFVFAKLGTGEFVLFRRIWKNNRKFVQGLMINMSQFINKMFYHSYQDASIATISSLLLQYNHVAIGSYSKIPQPYRNGWLQNEKLNLFQSNLVKPFSDLTLIFRLNAPIQSVAKTSIYTLGIIFYTILILLFVLGYRLIINKVSLAQQQQNFVSSVTHELKTPLTSIRMYGEMLLNGWANESKKQEYYQYIFSESERLTRLIENVLKLSSISHNNLSLNLKSEKIGNCFQFIIDHIGVFINNAGYKFNTTKDPKIVDSHILIDRDALLQIMINLVDNAIKFSQKSAKKQIDLSCRILGPDKIEFIIRDYGQGIENKQMDKIFNLFYRLENEQTRESTGTGIGLALVKNLADEMKMTVTVENVSPGAAFHLICSLHQ